MAAGMFVANLRHKYKQYVGILLRRTVTKIY